MKGVSRKRVARRRMGKRLLPIVPISYEAWAEISTPTTKETIPSKKNCSVRCKYFRKSSSGRSRRRGRGKNDSEGFCKRIHGRENRVFIGNPCRKEVLG